MSGGVDSSVAAALLVKQGYDVIGIMLRLWAEEGNDALGQPNANRCCAPEAVAEAALRHRSHYEWCRAENARLRAWLVAALNDMGVACDASQANFVLARFGDSAEAEACDDYLKTQGLIVRRVGSYNLPECLRITVGDEAACRRVAHAVAQFRGQR